MVALVCRAHMVLYVGGMVGARMVHRRGNARGAHANRSERRTHVSETAAAG
jgi:hypothetical protein